MKKKMNFFFVLIFTVSVFMPSTVLANETIDNIGQTVKQIFLDVFQKEGTNEDVVKSLSYFGGKADEFFALGTQLVEHANIPEFTKNIVKKTRRDVDRFEVDKPLYKLLDSAENLVQDSKIADLYNSMSNGPLTVKGYYKQRIEYTDNVFYEPVPDDDDVLFTSRPGVLLNYRFGEDNKNQIKAFYEANYINSIKYDEIDDFGQIFGASGTINLTDDVYVKFLERFIKTSSRPATNNLKRVEYVDQQIRPSIGYNWGDWTAEVGYDNYHRWFDSDIFNVFQYEKNTLYAGVYRTIAPGVKGLLEYELGYYDYKKSRTRSSRYWQISSGIQGRISKKTSLSARLGFQDREYKRGRSLILNQEDQGFSSVVTNIKVRHRFNKRTSLEARYTRGPQESTFTDNRFYDEQRFSLDLNHIFTSKFRGKAGIYYTNHEFPVKTLVGRAITNRDDNIFGTHLAMDYAFKPWMIMTTGYTYERQSSNSNPFDYTNNSVTVDFTFPF